MDAVLTLARKDLVLLWRDRAALFWVFVFPLVVAILFGTMYGGGERAAALPIVAVDEDQSPGSRAFLATLEASSAVRVERAERAQAETAVRTGRVVAAVIAGRGLDRALSGRPVEGSVLELRIDPSRRAETGILRGVIVEAAFQNITLPPPLELFPGLRQAVGIPQPPPIELVAVRADNERLRTAFEISFPSGMVWGLIGCVATFALSLVRERVGGTFLRLRVAPISHAQILAGKALACYLACVLELLVLLAVGVAFFDIRPSSISGLAVALAASAACFVGLMMLLAQIGRGEIAVMSAGWAIMLVMAMFGGAMMPFFLMPEWMQQAGKASPVRWAILALEGALWRGFSWHELLRPSAILLATGIGSFLAGLFLMRRRAV